MREMLRKKMWMSYVLVEWYCRIGMDHQWSLGGKCKKANGSQLDNLHSDHKFLDKDPDTCCGYKLCLEHNLNSGYILDDSLHMDFQYNQGGRNKILLHFVLYTQHLHHMEMVCKELVFLEKLVALELHTSFKILTSLSIII